MMKKLLGLFLLIGITFSVQADVFKYEVCSENKLNLIQNAKIFKNKALANFITDEVLAKQTTCAVFSPRPMFPYSTLDCGREITQLDTYRIETSENSLYTIVVDSTYKSCYRMRIIPFIKTFKYEKAPLYRPI